MEIHDHRRSNSNSHARETSPRTDTEAEVKRVVMQPTAESIWADICLLNEESGFTWTEDIALQVEAQILVSMVSIVRRHLINTSQLATEEPLCLDPSFQVSRVSNAVLHATGKRRIKKKQNGIRLNVSKSLQRRRRMTS